jgi:hypothetical protein
VSNLLLLQVVTSILVMAKHLSAEANYLRLLIGGGASIFGRFPEFRLRQFVFCLRFEW